MRRLARRNPGIPFVVTEAVMALMRAADAARREMVQALAPYEITLQQFNILIILRHAGSQGLPTLEVAARLVEQTPGITRLMNTLVAKRYIRRRRSKLDQRQQLCSLTDDGIRLIDRVLPQIQASQARIVKPIDPKDLDRFIELLSRIPPKPVGATDRAEANEV
jgi:DNA-binding MarR family transcriptional regulator